MSRAGSGTFVSTSPGDDFRATGNFCKWPAPGVDLGEQDFNIPHTGEIRGKGNEGTINSKANAVVYIKAMPLSNEKITSVVGSHWYIKVQKRRGFTRVRSEPLFLMQSLVLEY